MSTGDAAPRDEVAILRKDLNERRLSGLLMPGGETLLTLAALLDPVWWAGTAEWAILALCQSIASEFYGSGEPGLQALRTAWGSTDDDTPEAIAAILACARYLAPRGSDGQRAILAIIERHLAPAGQQWAG